jgi:uncharacterized surface protein with fasciclin (FAS1) repeats
MLRTFAALGILASASAFSVATAGDCSPGACSSGEKVAATPVIYAANHGKDIIDIATGDGMSEVTTLVAAIKAADLVDALKGKGPFTVFAPTNAAFAKLPAGTVDTLLKPENKEQLKSILLYHVHAGAAIKAADVKTMNLSTLNGKDLNIKVEGGNVMVNNAKVIKTDIVGTNGVIHWIDAVVLP